ncbi:MAG TPA: response regulator [Candidatus Saccharimonadales bacterium]|nr:response regulator [Candidatus Saccharimonadales bacterium]
MGGTVGTPADRAPVSGSRPWILVVDDDEACRSVLEAVLSDDYQVALAANGQEALDRCAEREPDLIVLDLDMPLVDGREFIERRRAAGSPDTPILVVSAVSGARTMALELTVRGIIPKPFNVEEVHRTVAGLLDRTGAFSTEGQGEPQER